MVYPEGTAVNVTAYEKAGEDMSADPTPTPADGFASAIRKSLSCIHSLLLRTSSV